MAESPEQIRKHIAVLSDFEQKYGEFLVAAHNEWAGDGKTWTREEFAKRKREIQMLAVRADLAMKASGVGQIFITHPPAMGGGVKSTDLPSQVFDFDAAAFGDDGMEIQRMILDRIPSQIAGLEVMLEEVEKNDAKTQRKPHPHGGRWPTLVGRVRHVPPVIGFIADIGGFVLVVGFIGRLLDVW